MTERIVLPTTAEVGVAVENRLLLTMPTSSFDHTGLRFTSVKNVTLPRELVASNLDDLDGSTIPTISAKAEFVFSRPPCAFHTMKLCRTYSEELCSGFLDALLRHHVEVRWIRGDKRMERFGTQALCLGRTLVNNPSTHLIVYGHLDLSLVARSIAVGRMRIFVGGKLVILRCPFGYL